MTYTEVQTPETGPRRRATPMRVVVIAAVLAFGSIVVAAIVIWNQYPVHSDSSARPIEFTADDLGSTEATAHNGRDFSFVSADSTAGVCDSEADGNIVKAEYELSRDKTVILGDASGSDERCSSITLEQPVLRHRVCERHLGWWTCGNWQEGQ